MVRVVSRIEMQNCGMTSQPGLSRHPLCMSLRKLFNVRVVLLSSYLAILFLEICFIVNRVRGQSFLTLDTGVGWDLQNAQKFYFPSIFVLKFSYPIEK